ncbi:hypothetical protein E3N88_12426 [Mikania micrantha]|uniref:OTU domain-containing protein n=1 Tax=Mikania micrantha TaxID=192012 RepID=A0A5N6P822_9ASTR|nr:hypothetical protein E3N88_12426 [Mikania micrantha]
MPQIPLMFHPYVSHVENVMSDGNCGFRSMAHDLGCGIWKPDIFSFTDIFIVVATYDQCILVWKNHEDRSCEINAMRIAAHIPGIGFRFSLQRARDGDAQQKRPEWREEGGSRRPAMVHRSQPHKRRQATVRKGMTGVSTVPVSSLPQSRQDPDNDAASGGDDGDDVVWLYQDGFLVRTPERGVSPRLSPQTESDMATGRFVIGWNSILRAFGTGSSCDMGDLCRIRPSVTPIPLKSQPTEMKPPGGGALFPLFPVKPLDPA